MDKICYCFTFLLQMCENFWKWYTIKEVHRFHETKYKIQENYFFIIQLCCKGYREHAVALCNY